MSHQMTPLGTISVRTGNQYVLSSAFTPLAFIYQKTLPIGWEPRDDGFRGHVFATQDNSTVVLSIKGTSAGYFGGTGPTGKKDRINDNLLFSCCCAHVDWTWTEVCRCHRGGWKCDRNCTEQALVADEGLFYPIGMVSLHATTFSALMAIFIAEFI
jgi:lipase ATG15